MADENVSISLHDVEIGSTDAIQSSVFQVSKFTQHEDFDVIIPDRIARPLVWSAHLLLVTAFTSGFVKNRWDLAATLVAVYITSILHWSRPRFSSWARLADYTAVTVAVTYGTWVSTTLLPIYTYIWGMGIGLVGCVFAANETLYYMQVMKLPSGSDSAVGGAVYVEDRPKVVATANVTVTPPATVAPPADSVCFCLQVTYANTQQREDVYKRTVFVHLFCVHIFANALAMTIVLSY